MPHILNIEIQFVIHYAKLPRGFINASDSKSSILCDKTFIFIYTFTSTDLKFTRNKIMRYDE